MNNEDEFMDFVVKNNERPIKQGEHIDKLLQHQNIEERILERLSTIEYRLDEMQYKIDTISKQVKENNNGYFDVFGNFCPKER